MDDNIFVNLEAVYNVFFYKVMRYDCIGDGDFMVAVIVSLNRLKQGRHIPYR